MDGSHENAGVVVDQRLAPAGLTRVLGGYGNGRATVLGLAAVLFAGATAALLLLPAPPASISTMYILPVALAAAEIGTRVGVLCAAASIATVLLAPVGGTLTDGPATFVARSFALFFLAFAVGRLSDRAAKSRGMLEQVLEATTDSIYLKDLEGRYLLVNSAAARLIGQPGRAILGHSNTELLPELAEEIADHDSDVIERDSPDAYEISGRFGARSYILSVTKSPFRDATGATIGALGIARDITDQRRLQAESTRFFDLSGDMLCTVDFDGHLRRVNGEWRKTLGWSPAELIGRHASDLMDREDHELMGEASRAGSAKGARGANVTTRWRHKDGSWRWIDWTLRTVVDERLIYASGRDVTQRRDDERALASSESRYARSCTGCRARASSSSTRRCTSSSRPASSCAPEVPCPASSSAARCATCCPSHTAA